MLRLIPLRMSLQRPATTAVAGHPEKGIIMKDNIATTTTEGAADEIAAVPAIFAEMQARRLARISGWLALGWIVSLVALVAAAA